MQLMAPNKNGVTLTELLVSSILVGIVMIGVASFSGSIQHLHNSTNRTAILTMKAMTAMNLLARDAYLTIGTVGDETARGIITRSINPFKSICFRHDVDDPASYADDEYVCYLFETNNNNRKFSRCTSPTPLADVPPNNAAKCGGAARDILLTMDPALGDVFQVNLNAVDPNRLESIDFTISAIFDPRSAPHPITNPTYTITTTVNPPGVSR